MYTPLENIAVVSLGYKSLQNTFFYVNKATIDTFGIEKKYLVRILMLKDMDSAAYEQEAKSEQWLFACKDGRADLRGTGALKYIDSMAGRAATEKKQSGKSQTIREALEAQSGGTWYAPKARTNHHNVWVRKAIDGVFAPFLFDKPALVDQRCNSVTPLAGISWKEIAAVLTTSLFAYSVEINGAASMGAGALEAPTKKLRQYPVLDVRALKSQERKKLVSLAESVWASENPIDWGASGTEPGSELRALDQWILHQTSRKSKIERVYADIHSVCESRIAVAGDKVKKTKKKQTENIGNVADSIVNAIQPKLQTRNFPDDFVSGTKLDVNFNFDRRSIKQITVSHLLDSYDIEVITTSGGVAYEGTHPRAVAEAIIRALLWGRSVFSVSSDRKAMDHAVNQFILWVSDIEGDIETAITESALGTGYEDVLKREVYNRLGIHPLSGAKTLPSQISL
jgi:hypothetical protein